jgi:acyl-CoA thioester hydrolase
MRRSRASEAPDLRMMRMNSTLPEQLTETQRGSVNAWQCDVNRHWNVQFYCRHFDQAARFLALGAGAGPADPLPPTRHLRYHAELVAGDIFRISSARIADGAHAGSLVHYMHHAGSGRLIATALDGQATRFDCNAVPQAAVPEALPRSIAGGAEEPLVHQRVLDAGGLASVRCWVTMSQCTAAGELTQEHLVGMFADAAGHVWERAGAGVVWLRENGLGRAAVEMKLSHYVPARAGDALVLYSWVGPTRGKSIMLQHQLCRLPDNEPIARSDVTALLIDMQTRRSVAMPPLGATTPEGSR